MRRSLITLAATALFAVAACSGSSATAAPTAAPATAAPASASPAASVAAPAGGGAVAIKNFTFNPAALTVKVGDTVKWLNGDDTAHTVTFDDTSLGGSGNLNTGNTFELAFSKAGSFTYHCKIHPSMKATVTVS